MVNNKFKSFANRLAPFIPPNYLARIGYPPDRSGLIFPNEKSVSSDIALKYGDNSEFGKIYSNHKGHLVHKWHHYLHLYDQYFSKFKNKKNLKFLEIGVSKGGSLQMWREFFGEDATIFGVDIDPNCKQYDGLFGEVRIGSQDDKEFLESVVKEMGGVDIVLDDGSHIMKHIRDSLDILFPLLSYEGTYFIEDLHTCYWGTFGGGYGSKNSFFETVSDIINDMHRWYHLHSIKKPQISKNCSAIHIHDSIVVFEKNITYKPQHSEKS